MTHRERVRAVLEADPAADRLGRIVDVLLFALIVANVVAVILETVAAVRTRFATALTVFEWVSVGIFSVEYVLRVWSCAAAQDRGAIAGRVRFMATPMALVDLAAILPAYVPFLIPVDLRFVRVLRLMRLARALKLTRYSDSLALLGSVLRAKRAELLITAFAGGLLLVLASGLMFVLEHDAQPEVFSSMPAAIWWGVVTLTTVGYGDIYPVTPLGKLLSGAIGILGIGLFALPAGILAGGFAEALQRSRATTTRTCPHCGKPID